MTRHVYAVVCANSAVIGLHLLPLPNDLKLAIFETATLMLCIRWIYERAGRDEREAQ